MKGLLIILVVTGHSGCPVSAYIALFHMSVFLMVSGFLYKEKCSDTFSNIRKYVLNKIKTIWFSYFIWSIIFVVLNNTFIKLHIYSSSEFTVNGINTYPLSISHTLSRLR